MTKQDLTKPDPFELVNLSVRLFRAHRDLIDQVVAERAEKDPDYCLSDYVRDTMVDDAAGLLKVPVPTVPSIVRGRGGSLAQQAAAKLGMTREEFEQAAIRNAAAMALGANAVDATTAPSRKPSGTYARGSSPPEAVQRPRRVTGR